MTNEEMLAKLRSAKSLQDVYELACKEIGYTGSLAEFEALIEKASAELPMDMDDLEKVAGGLSWSDIGDGLETAWDGVKRGLSAAGNWISENPDTFAAIVGGTVGVASLVCTGVWVYRSYQQEQHDIDIMNRMSIDSVNNDPVIVTHDMIAGL